MKSLHHAFRDRNVLVTGATGLLGSALVRRLLDLSANVVCFVRDPDPASALWDSGDIDRVSVALGRLEVFEHVKAALVEREIDTVFHLGAQPIVGAAKLDPLGTFESNIRGTYHVLEACRLYGEERVRRIVVASSDKAYGELPLDKLPYTEQTPLAASNPYDVSKSCADLIAQSYAATYGLPIAIARCGNLFGPGDLNWSRLIPGTIRALVRGERPVVRSDGTPTRDFLFIDDAVRAYLELARWLDFPFPAALAGEGWSGGPAADSPRAFNFSSGKPISVLAMTQMLQQACGRADLQPIVQNRATNEITDQCLDCTRAQHELGWCAAADLTLALRQTVEWYRAYLTRFAHAAHSLVMPAVPNRASA